MSNTTSFDTESTLFEPVAAYLRRKGYRWQEKEVPFYEYRVDLYGFSKACGHTVAVELKLHKWQRALEQAVLYQLCADFAYIAMPVSSIVRVNAELLENHGIGLLAVRENGHCRQILPASKSTVVEKTYTKEYIKWLEGRAECHR